jgi:invasion protein IalB
MLRPISALSIATALVAVLSSSAWAQENLVYSPWIKIIGPLQQGSDVKLINTSSSAATEDGEPRGAAMILELENNPQKILRIVMPAGVDTAGPRVVLDGKTSERKPFTCQANACFADFELTADLLAKLKTSKTLTIEANKTGGASAAVPLPLATFASIYDGPPVDIKVIEAQNEKLRDELQRKADAMRKKLESESKK